MNNNDFIHMTSTDLMFQITYGVLCVFSFISGFFNVSSINSKHDFVRYMVKRLEKLYPIYMLSCISLYTIGDLSLKQCILSLTLVGGMIARPYPGTIWFVAMIIFFNFLTQIIALSKRHRKVTLIVCIELALVLLSACRMIDLRLAYYFPSYVLGMLIRSAVDDGENDIFDLINNIIRVEKAGSVFLKLIFITIIYLFVCNGIGKELTIVSCMTSLVLLFLLLSVGAFLTRTIKSWLLLKVIIRLSESTMSIYLFHRLIFQMAVNLSGKKLTVITACFVVSPIAVAMCYYFQWGYSILYKKIFKTGIL